MKGKTKMKNTFKKLSALLLVLVMVLAMSANAFAADMSGEKGVIGEFTEPDKATVQDTSVIIYKEITAYNPEGSDVNAPEITFAYEIVPGSAGKNIYDASDKHDPAANAHVLTKAGVGTPSITNVVLTTGTPLKTSANGTANRFPITISFGTIFKNGTTANYAAGVYRYVINEKTTAETKNAANIKDGDVANTLYLDVYVNGSGDIYGYVLFANNEVDIDARDDKDAATAAGKTEGFVGSKSNEEAYDAEADSVADKYYTFNLAVTKNVKNDDYIKNTHHQFPFTVTLDNPTVTANVLPIMTVGENATQTALSAGAIGTGENATVWTPTIADSATITYVGIPTGTTVTIKEKNNVAGVTYTSDFANADNDAVVEAKNIYTDEFSNEAIVDCNDEALKVAAENHTGAKMVTFTNTLLQISPTGIVMRVAPYVLILAAGVALLVLSRRRREDEV